MNAIAIKHNKATQGTKCKATTRKGLNNCIDCLQGCFNLFDKKIKDKRWLEQRLLSGDFGRTQNTEGKYVFSNKHRYIYNETFRKMGRLKSPYLISLWNKVFH